MFESRLVVNYQDVEVVKKKAQFGENVQIRHPIPQNSVLAEATDAIFDLAPIHPTDLNARFFSKKHANGNVEYEVGLKDGLKHGRYISYYSDGTEKITGHFRKDEQVGTWRYYGKDGELVRKKRFR